jgi:hypothetical protein
MALTIEKEAAPTPAGLTDEMDAWQAASNTSLANLLGLVVEYDRQELWAVDGATSMAAWLTSQYGLTPRSAKDWMEVAHGLVELPAVRAEFAEGRLSFDQLKFVCRLADRETDQHWAIEASKHSASRLEVMARRKREITAAESNEAHRQRFLRMRWDTDNRLLRYRGCLPEEQGALFEAAINRLVGQMGNIRSLASTTTLTPGRRMLLSNWHHKASGQTPIRIGPPWWSTSPRRRWLGAWAPVRSRTVRVYPLRPCGVSGVTDGSRLWPRTATV